MFGSRPTALSKSTAMLNHTCGFIRMICLVSRSNGSRGFGVAALGHYGQSTASQVIVNEAIHRNFPLSQVMSEPPKSVNSEDKNCNSGEGHEEQNRGRHKEDERRN